MKKILLLILASVAVSLYASSAEPETEDLVPYYKYRVYLKDKGRRTASLMKHPERYLSTRSIERRAKQGLAIDYTDLPVNAKYIRDVAATGVEVLLRSRWNNTLVVRCEDTTMMEAVRALPFVKEAVQVAHYEKSPLNIDKNRLNLLSQEPHEPDTSYYAQGVFQITSLNGLPLHEAGFRGEGMCIAVIDGGFLNSDTIPAMQNTRIVGTHNFVMPGVSVFDWNNDHGQAVLSCMGTNTPHVMVGTAPEAEYWLLISEDGNSEQPVEEDNWAAAIEFADSVGADVINSSLGYGSYDAPYGKIPPYEYNGRTRLVSRTASMAASKGMVVCCAAGNSGEEILSTIAVPADADNIITVGSVATIYSKQGKSRDVMFFSSRGGSYDGRIKPDVVCEGLQVIGSNGTRTFSYGTSISSPVMCGMVTSLWQALPELTASEIIDIVRRSGNHADAPDNTWGYGEPDFAKAWEMGKALAAKKAAAKKD